MIVLPSHTSFTETSLILAWGTGLSTSRFLESDDGDSTTREMFSFLLGWCDFLLLGGRVLLLGLDRLLAGLEGPLTSLLLLL